MAPVQNGWSALRCVLVREMTMRAHLGHWGDVRAQQPAQNTDPQDGQVFNALGSDVFWHPAHIEPRSIAIGVPPW